MQNENNAAHNEKVPQYIRIYDNLKKKIIEGDYSYGSRLPSRKTMADEMNVSVITIKHAYELLCDEGYLESKERSGYYVIFKKEDGFVSTAKIINHEGHSYHRTTYAFPFSVLTKAMRKVVNDYGEAILERPSNKGCEETREAIRKYLARNRNIHVDISQIIIGSGAEYLYNLIVGLFSKDTVFALESPSYKKIEQVYRMSGVTCEMLPLEENGISSSALLTTTASILHISPYRSFPSGVTASASKKYEYIRWASQGERYIIEDDFESEFSISSKPEETMFSISDRDNVIYMNSFSQTISSSLRAAYMVLPKQLTQIFDDRLGFYSCTVPTFEQLVIAQLINSGDFERHINRVRRNKRKA
ncbi:GntR family transcriptional regulator / MocR family aminotransferase [Pseudobutyrivibrio sp. ACV-2]|uniref:MocR-like pyridoxine biosynthesis transcription factor PdxR n=1 Tax=Pseudobutyrivibrio sp. ACV-2 TaxID=1520801 RepID=UPI0008985995|nr:PLP-dependent aminotransferase family protein [Pseudobutyrivibrio sp. ACV-2]SEA99536.1 GntR family transcriptional regulator / MocR family aminotransferase [Pseudobutyrivibrio sp. ACV-2]